MRTSDRIEAGARLMALLLAVLMIAPAAAFGTSVYDHQRQLAARQAVEWHTVAATAVDTSMVVSRFAAVRFRSHVRWSANGSFHDAWLDTPDNVNSGGQTAVWINSRGELVGPPLTHDELSAAAFGATLSVWLAVTGVLWLAVRVLTWRLDCRRHAGWETDWQALDRDRGGRKDRFWK
ncbi:hypothetical protein FZI85_04140 [Mycobacterium sp. CBMA293]|uniref:Rv1733c family protein n=1 Tax=unclassified Mycolicibacterium TaxID=2636767 RepID=UPI0012DE683E|nr:MULTISPECIES: hypothetical protein [unclassified Mycolicibacterium]MUL93386.1 hypothetical protein [Mycolicibacterium sp. CBMA 230]MUL47125.1 hypothetical protein [Mycolicibacterium sp. CBMA 360]MUL58503.1 hypothetical protein [Mycolicibacterium sp. CBMA 335]MUM04601.1 hypothetical protein [Mycolicibacterium sp. CBMA 213]MUM10229.1 hypothetical protein [Mycolicibacterium sp. CBMA 293]